MLDKELLAILACPETKKDLELADPSVVAKVNAAIKEGKVQNRSRQKVSQKIDGGLMRKGDTHYIYPIRDGIPILLIDELISLDAIIK